MSHAWMILQSHPSSSSLISSFSSFHLHPTQDFSCQMLRLSTATTDVRCSAWHPRSAAKNHITTLTPISRRQQWLGRNERQHTIGIHGSLFSFLHADGTERCTQPAWSSRTPQRLAALVTAPALNLACFGVASTQALSHAVPAAQPRIPWVTKGRSFLEITPSPPGHGESI